MKPSALTKLALSLCLIMSAGCSADIQGGIESANDLLYEKKYVEAERLYFKLLKRLGEDGELGEKASAQRLVVLDRLGKINALYLKDYEKALRIYERLVSLYPKTEQAFAAHAMVADIHHHKLGNLDAAISEYQKIVADFPDKDETRWAKLQIVSAFFQGRDYEQARTEAAALIKRWPTSAEAAQARFQVANSFYVQGRYAEAVATYEVLLEGDPDPSLASLVLFELGNCFQELGDFDRALAYYYACLAEHQNPMLVQRKIRRVRTRMNYVRPREEITLPAYVTRRLDNARVLEEEAKEEPRKKSSRGRAPESDIYGESRFDEEEDLDPVEPAPPAPAPDSAALDVEAPQAPELAPPDTPVTSD